MIDSQTVDRIIETARIEEVIGDFVSLKRRGANYVACCPFHNEKTPSFSVSPSKGVFKCFGCGKAGSAIKFVMEHEQMSYVEALKFIGNKYGIEVREKEESAEQVQQRLHNESLMIVNDFAQKYFTKILMENPEGRAVGLSYFKERGFEDDTINKFLLGYAPNEKRALTHNAQKEGYKVDFLKELGLTIEREGTGELFDRFYDRVMFPIRSISGKVIAFGGRKLRGGKEIAKYINSPESALYVKNKVLYGIFEAKGAIAKEQKCYLVEGYTDVISFHQAGIENVVASSGTSLTQGQIQLIKRFTNKVTVLYDGDWAGIKASLRGIDMLLEEGLEVKVALFPEGEDPDSYARAHTKDEIKEFLAQNEEDFIAFKHKVLSSDLDKDPLQRAKIIGEIVNSIAIIPDAIVRNVYIEDTAGRMNISGDLLQQEVNKLRQKKQNDDFFRKQREEERLERLAPVPQDVYSAPAGTWDAASAVIPGFVVNTYCEEAEKEILYYLLKFGYLPIRIEEEYVYGAEIEEEQTVAQYILAQLQNDDLELQNLLYKGIFDEYFSLKEHEGERILRYFVNHPDPKVSEIVASLLAQPYILTIQQFTKSLIPERNVLGRVVPKAILVYKAKVTAQAAINLTAELAKVQKSANEESLEELMNQLNMLMQVRTVFSKELNRIIF